MNDTTKREKIIIFVVAVLLIGVVTGIAVFRLQDDDLPDFVPPDFESQAESEIPTDMGEHYKKLPFRIDGGICTVALDAHPEVKQNDLRICFTSTNDNTVWIRIVLYDGDLNIIGESGLLRPGEYLDSVTLNKTVSQGDKLEAKILTYQPDTYYSMGAVTLTVEVR